MKYEEGTPEYGLKQMASKYGAVLAVMLLNYVGIRTFLQIFFYVIVGVTLGDDALSSETDIGYFLFLVLNDIVSYLVPILVCIALFRHDLKNPVRTLYEPAYTVGEDGYIIQQMPDPGYRRFPGDIALLFIAGSFMASIGSMLTGYVSEFLNWLFNVPETQMAFSGYMPQGVWQYLSFVLFVVFTGPIIEELIYRHLLLRPLRKYGDLAAIFVSSLFFGLSHFNFDQFLYTFFFGFTLGLIAVRSDSVKPSIVCHIINNAIATLTAYMPETLGDETIDTAASILLSSLNALTVAMFWAGAVAVLIAAALKCFDIKNNCEIPEKKQFAIIFSNPVTIIFIILCLALTFLLLYF